MHRIPKDDENKEGYSQNGRGAPAQPGIDAAVDLACRERLCEADKLLALVQCVIAADVEQMTTDARIGAHLVLDQVREILEASGAPPG